MGSNEQIPCLLIDHTFWQKRKVRHIRRVLGDGLAIALQSLYLYLLNQDDAALTRDEILDLAGLFEV